MTMSGVPSAIFFPETSTTSRCEKLITARMIEKIKELKERYKLTVLMAEQNFPQALRIADRGYVIVHGQIAFEGRSAEELNNNDLIKKFYLGL